MIDDGPRPKISVILPCYRAAPLARRSARELGAALQRLTPHWEIVIVDDGGGDFGTDPVADDTRVRVVRLPENRGKGAAVVAGLLQARGRARIYTDVDLPFGAESVITAALLLLDRRCHVVAGDRTLPTSRYALDIGWRRRLASAVFSTFVGTMVTGGFFDTQCGLKGLRGDVAEDVARMIRIRRFAFDVELLYLALRFGFTIARLPVRLRNNETSSVRLLNDSLRMLADVLRIKVYQMRGAYESEPLRLLVAREAEHALARAGFAAPVSDVEVARPPVRDIAASPPPTSERPGARREREPQPRSI